MRLLLLLLAMPLLASESQHINFKNSKAEQKLRPFITITLVEGQQCFMCEDQALYKVTTPNEIKYCCRRHGIVKQKPVLFNPAEWGLNSNEPRE